MGFWNCHKSHKLLSQSCHMEQLGRCCTIFILSYFNLKKNTIFPNVLSSCAIGKLCKHTNLVKIVSWTVVTSDKNHIEPTKPNVGNKSQKWRHMTRSVAGTFLTHQEKIRHRERFFTFPKKLRAYLFWFPLFRLLKAFSAFFYDFIIYETYSER